MKASRLKELHDVTMSVVKNNGPKNLQNVHNSSISFVKKRASPAEILAKRPGTIKDECFKEASYYFENGLRKVYPYFFTFSSFTKARWVGKRITDVFSREFKARPIEEYERCIENGLLQVNYEKVNNDYCLKYGDLITCVMHRHETPVLATPIKIIHVDNDFVVVDKPCSIPTHPCGRFRSNSMIYILAKEYNLRDLYPVYRLDRLTSGLLMIARSSEKAALIHRQICSREVKKMYICRVEGEFPTGEVVCNEPIEVFSKKVGVCRVDPKGKECKTVFQRVGYNGKTSVVCCKPLTGKMHQIRVHLQYLGSIWEPLTGVIDDTKYSPSYLERAIDHSQVTDTMFGDILGHTGTEVPELEGYPILNDPIYNHEIFGPEKGRGGNFGRPLKEVIEDLIKVHSLNYWLGLVDESDVNKGTDDILEKENETIAENKTYNIQNDPCGKRSKGINQWKAAALLSNKTGYSVPDAVCDRSKITVDPHCCECKVPFKDPPLKDLVMYLHAWKYTGPGWSFNTELPDWARPDWIEPE